MTAVLLADPMGLGKTIQALGVLNYKHIVERSITLYRVLVVCPASLRLNWVREMDKWLLESFGAMAILSGQEDRLGRLGPLVVSYNLVANPDWIDYLTEDTVWNVVIFDEGHYLKNIEAKRTQACLNLLAGKAENVLVLTGTPIPNRAHEFFPFLSTLVPVVIDNMNEQQYMNKFTVGKWAPYGYQVVGGKNHAELNRRLRASGFMIRRDKRRVLPQLPPERYNMVVFPQDTLTAQIVEKEKPFSVREILDYGKPLGYGSLPDLRHEMAVAKTPEAIKWIKDHMESGCEKLVVFAYHKEVFRLLKEGLKKYNPVMVTGSTSAKGRQEAVDRFQKDPEVQIIMGGWQPLGIGWTLTAACDVCFVEHSYVPGENDQCKDRVVRIGQEADSVNVYYLVVEGSLDADILAAAARKEEDISRVLRDEKL